MECLHIPSSSYAEFSRQVHDRLRAERVPIAGSLEVTERCNLRCGHCYINRPAVDAQARAGELSAGELASILDQITDEGCLWLLITGGEPFVRQDFLEIYLHAKRNGLLLTLFTNGTMLTPQIADTLAEWPPFSMEITLYGATQATYEQVTGVPGSYARCMRGIELLLERQIPLKLKTSVTMANRDELPEMNAFAESRGVSYRFDPVLNMRLDGGQTPGVFRLSPEEVVALDMQDVKRVAAWQETCERFKGPPPHPENLYQCGAGMNSFHIDAYGQLSMCMMARESSYNLRTGSFHTGWHTTIQAARMRQRTGPSPCQTCELTGLCAQCPGVASIETGNPEQPVPYYCQITHLRAAAFGPDALGVKHLDGLQNDQPELGHQLE